MATNRHGGFSIVQGWQDRLLGVIADAGFRQAHRVFVGLLSFGQGEGKVEDGTFRYSRIWPSMATLAARCGTTKPTTERAVAAMAEMGLVRIQSGHQGRSNGYELATAGEAFGKASDAMRDRVMTMAEKVAKTIPLADPKADRAFRELRRQVRTLIDLGTEAQSITGDGLSPSPMMVQTITNDGPSPSPMMDYLQAVTHIQLNHTQQKQKPPAAAALVAAQEMEAKPDRTERPLSGEEAIKQMAAVLAERGIAGTTRTKTAERLVAMGIRPEKVAEKLTGANAGLAVHRCREDAEDWLREQHEADQAERLAEERAGRDAVAKAKAIEKADVEATMRDQMEPARAAELVRDLAARQSIDMARLEELISKAFAKGAKRQPTAKELAALVEEFEPIARLRKAMAKIDKAINPATAPPADPEPTVEELPLVERIKELLRPKAKEQAQAFRPPVTVALPQASPQPEAMVELLPGDLVRRIGELPPEEQSVFERVVGPKIRAAHRAKSKRACMAVGGRASTTFEATIDGGGASTTFEATIDGGSAVTFAAVAA